MRNILLVALLFISALAAAEEREHDNAEKHTGEEVEVTLESTISGNREQPKVLYIVPWQLPEGSEIFDRSFQRAFEGLFKPVERESFLRELNVRARQTPQTLLNSDVENRSDVE